MKRKNHLNPSFIRQFLTITLLAAASLLFTNSLKAQTTIANVYPDGNYQFEPSPSLTFTAASAAGINPTNITVQLTITSLQTGNSFINVLTTANGLTVGGTPTNPSVSAPLSSNTLYVAVIKVKDNSGASASSSVTFDTISGYTFEAEDFDYTSNGVTGLFVDNPQTNAYAGLVGTEGVDYYNNSVGSGGANYRPQGLETEGAGDLPRRQYATGKQDYDVGYNNGGEFGNYTRHYPPGVYNVFLRGSGGNGPQTDAASLTVSAGTASLSGASTGTGSSPFQFSVAGLGWQTYTWCPLKDSAGNLAQLTVPDDGTASTITATIDHGNCNENFYLLVPVNTNVAVSTVTITNVYPDGAWQFEATNALVFTAFSSVNINPAYDVLVILTGTNLVTGAGSVTTYTTANGLVISGSSTSTSITATIPLATNSVYTAVIQVNDANGIPTSFTEKFDTIVPTYTFEGEDFNYGGGNFFDNPQTNAYAGLDGQSGIDFNNNTAGISGNAGYNRLGLPGESANDVPRKTHVGEQDYDLGNTSGGNWGDYSRTYPAGVYNIFVRYASGNSGTTADAGNISLVTSDPTQSGQSVQQLGKYTTSGTGSWQTYAWAPVINAGGSLARFVADGTVKTLRLTFDGAGHNVNYILLLPANLSINPPPYVSAFEPDGTGLFQSTNELAFVANSSVGLAKSNIVVNLNGVNVSGLTISGSSTAWNVSYSVKTNALYTAVITLTDSAGSTKYTNTFNTFSANNYQWEAEDYDYTGGQYYDNPQVGSYAGQGGTVNVDLLEADPNAFSRGYAYRAANGVDFPDTQSGDLPRTQFTTAGVTDYSIGSFGVGSFANYTRHYPAGSYTVVGRFAEGAAPSSATLSILTGGYGTTAQTTNFIGTFNVALGGWSSWEWTPLVDTNGNPAQFILDGTQQTLQLGGGLNSQPEVNVNFFQLVPITPKPTLTAVVAGGNIIVSLPTVAGYSYQVLYKVNLTDATWTPLGSALSGNGSVQSVSAPASGHSRFYQVLVQ